MKRYYNATTKEWCNEGQSMTRRVENGVFMGYPTEEQLRAWGFEEVVPLPPYTPTAEELKRQRMTEIQAELSATDYLSLKAFEGEDMSEHPTWKEDRAALRAEYRTLESELLQNEEETE